MPSKSAAKFSKREMIDALLRSGYLIEGRLQTAISNDDPNWFTIPNDSYLDPITQKSRELDLHVIRGVIRNDGPFKGKHLMGLYIECVNNPYPLVLLTRPTQTSIAHNTDFIKMTGLPVVVLDKADPKVRLPLQSYLQMDTYHHYAQGPVANQFCSFSRKNSSAQWMASHQEEHFNCFTKLIDAVEHYSDLHYKALPITDPPTATTYMYYPTLVLQGDLYEAKATKRAVTLRKANHLQYRHATHVNSVYKRYQIDVVTEKYFPKYLRMIADEFSRTVDLLGKDDPRLVESLQHLTQVVRGHDRDIFPHLLG